MNTFDVYYEKGEEEGIEKGKIEGKEEIVRNLLASHQFTISEIANFAGVPESLVEKVRASLG